jgi:hypothetical protein
MSLKSRLRAKLHPASNRDEEEISAGGFEHDWRADISVPIANRSDSPVDPAIFHLVERYAQGSNYGNDPTVGRLDATTYIVQFCVGFFQQFLKTRYDYPLTAVDDQAKVEVQSRRIRHRAADRRNDDHLIHLFFDFCDDWPSLAGLAYDASDQRIAKFHQVYIPRLLLAVREWADLSCLPEVSSAARDALHAYESGGHGVG